MTEHTLDCLGLICPLPVLKASKRLRDLAAGDILCVVADDPMAPLDLELMALKDGHRMIEKAALDGQTQTRIEKGVRPKSTSA